MSSIGFRPKNVIVYRISKEIDFSNLREQLKQFAYIPCKPHDLASTGWISPLGNLSEDLCYESNGMILLTQKKEKKILPPATINEKVREKQLQLEKEQKRILKSKEVDLLKAEVMAELLPKALSNYSTTNLWLDPKSRLLMVDSSSHKNAENANALLRKSLGSLPLIPFTLETPIELTLTEWVKTGNMPAGLTLCNEATLKAALEGGGVLTAKQQDLLAEEIASHLDNGKLVTKVAMCWMEAMWFVINDAFIISRITYGESLSEANDDIDKEDTLARFDADFVLITSTLVEVIDKMINELGGEAKNLPEASDGEEKKTKNKDTKSKKNNDKPVTNDGAFEKDLVSFSSKQNNVLQGE